MLRTLLASKAVKTLATCVCPVAGATAVTLGVPQVRHAVHQATSPREYAKPKTRVRPAVEAPCAEVAPIVLSPVASATYPTGPVQFADNLPSLPGSVGGGGLVPSGPGFPLVPVIGGGGGGGGNPGVPGGPDTPTTPVTPLPDAKTWVELIVGLGLVGGAARIASVRAKTAAGASPKGTTPAA